MDRRSLIALLVLFTLFMFYPAYLRLITPKTTIQTNLRGQPTAGNTINAPGAPSFTAAGQIPPVSEAAPLAALYEPATIDVRTEKLFATFTNMGGGIKRLACFTQRNGTIDETELFNAGDATPAGFGMAIPGATVDLERVPFVGPKLLGDGNTVEFEYTLPNQIQILKRFHLEEGNSPILKLSVEVSNPTGVEQPFSFELGSLLEISQPDNSPGWKSKARFEVLSLATYTKTSGEIQRVGFSKLKKKGALSEGLVQWVGLGRRYFALLIKPEDSTAFEQFRASANDRAIQSAARVAPKMIAPGGKQVYQFLIYAGPTLRSALKSYGAGFEQILSGGGVWGFFKTVMLVLLGFFYGVFRNYGLAIIAVALTTKIAFWPLTHKGLESMQKLQSMQPKLKAIQDQHRDNPEKLNKETMEFYKRHKVNPFGGCLPMVVQIPVFIALYQVLAGAVELRGAPFFGWIHDLSEPDVFYKLPVSVIFFRDAVRLLPILYILSTILQQRLQPQSASTSPEQQQMLKIMPIMMGFIFYHMPSGLILYFLTSNLLMCLEQVTIRRKFNTPPNPTAA